MQTQKKRALSQTHQEQHDGVGAHEDREAAAPERQMRLLQLKQQHTSHCVQVELLQLKQQHTSHCVQVELYS